MANLGELSDFIVSLSENPEMAQRFREDPEAVIREASLSEETKALLRLGQQDFLGEVLVEARRPRVTVVTKTSVHVSTNVNNHVTTHLIVVVL
jgi:Aromatic-ring-opening dioxygenase LigAB, LigA subunit